MAHKNSIKEGMLLNCDVIPVCEEIKEPTKTGINATIEIFPFVD